MGIISWFIYNEFSKNAVKTYEKAQFSVKKTTQNDIPNTVVFTYDIDEIDADSFFIQQSWDKNRRVKIFKNNHTLTDIYYEPGYHVAKLIANDSIIKKLKSVFQPINGFCMWGINYSRINLNISKILIQ